MKFASIIVDISHEKLDKTFQYMIPEELEEQIFIGTRVVVPFGMGNRKIAGYVISVEEQAMYPLSKMKSVYEVAKQSVPIESHLIALAGWIKKHYGGTMNQCLKTVLPIKDKVKNKEEEKIVLVVSEEEGKRLLEEIEKKKNLSARARLLKILLDRKEILKSEAKQKWNLSDSTINRMLELNLIAIEKKRIYRNPMILKQTDSKKILLNSQQREVADLIISRMNSGKEKKKPQLIHGITGSGKTEVYMEVIAAAIKEGKEAIVLIPEIALTYQTVMRFYQRFGDKIAILNSKMSAGERYDQMMKAKEGKVSIMIGPRSALFTPFKNLGLIIIDEEHESAYKSEGVPKYHARETAIARADMTGAMVVLGSATPSLESYYRALHGTYDLLHLNERAKKNELANVEVVDLREELVQGNRSIFSRRLKELIEDRLRKKQQIMIFINRRGFAGFVSCRSCGVAMKCPHCDVTLTYHKNQNGFEKLVCHYCGYEKAFPKTCPECGSKYISTFGTGTQKVEMLMKKEFPQAGILRMDMDTTKNKGGHQKILEAFAKHQADILIGTQMIVKGHDFPNVTLVGVIAADLSLYASDYRAVERTFQLLTQAAGRAGRGKEPGDVVIQTYVPDNYGIVCAARQDYNGFYKEEIAYRTLMKYPPVYHLMAILITAKEELKAESAAKKIAEKIKERVILFKDNQKTEIQKREKIELIGPADSKISKINDIFRKVIYVKAKEEEDLIRCQEAAEQYIFKNPDFAEIGVQFDLDPMGNY